MKRVIGFCWLGMTLSALCYGQAPLPETPVKGLVKEIDSRVISGTVKTLTRDAAIPGGKAEMVVTPAEGPDIKLLVPPTAQVFDADWKTVQADKVIIGGTVRVRYQFNKEGLAEVISISIVK
ncbi:MAG: hypothetical protein HQL23_05410 [Candidatus Omnitrophica bacterium]|nr:hypothetical protein [Candidatus Omnitrophota bacterium]